MGIFTIGNFITLGVVALALFLYRMMDKDNRSLDKIRRYTEKCKEEIAVRAAEKGAEVKDFGIALEVERKSAMELMRRLQGLTEQELAEKAKAITALDERLKTYDSSLEDLASMTGRVQENLIRIKEESGFVENVSKRISDTREKLEQFEKKLSVIENHFEKENYEALESISKEVMASVRSAVSDIEISAGAIERQVEEHRQAVDKIEQNRAAALAKDAEYINKMLKEALERAAGRADKMEDAAFVKLREQAQERLNVLKSAWEEKIKSVQDTVKSRLAEIQELLKTRSVEIQDQFRIKSAEINEQLKISKDNLKNECAGIEASQKAYRDEWKKNAQELDALAVQQQESWKKDIQEFNVLCAQQRDDWKKDIQEYNTLSAQQQEDWKKNVQELDALAAQQHDNWKKIQEELETLAVQQRHDWAQISRETEQHIIAASDTRIEEYKAAQDEQFKQLETLANDSAGLDAELRRLMQDAVNRVNGDFSRFQDESRQSREAVESEFNSLVSNLRGKLDAADQELAGLKSQAQQNVSEKLKLFEDDFYSDLEKRNSAVEKQLGSWQEQFDLRIGEIAKAGEEDRRQMELRFTGEQRKGIAEQGERILGELERLKTQTGAFEEGIREQMQAADDSCLSFREQLGRDLDEARALAETEINSHIGQYSLTMSETLRQNQRELEEQLRNINLRVEGWNSQLEEASETSRRGINDWQNQYSAQMRDMDASLEEIRRRSRETTVENDERVTHIKNDMELIRKELSAQAKLFDQNSQLKHELELKIEDLNGNMDRLDQRKNEIIQMENQFLQIKRLEDDVNAKMTRFLSEKRRIEVIEADFNRLLQTSQAVEEKLVQVSASDDTLQAVQVQIRRLNDSIKETEEKYQRIEKKNQVLDETNDGISRNFKAIQESEASLKKANNDIVYIFSELTRIRESIGILTAESERAQDAAGKLAILDEALPQLEKRIEEMQVARQWLARTETELQALDKDAQSQLRLMRSLLDRESGKKQAAGTKGAPPIRERENIIKLRRQGWPLEDIAKTMGISAGEVELILEYEKLDNSPRK